MSALKMYSPEWIAEAQRAPALLQAALADNKVTMAAAVESLEKLGIVVPITPKMPHLNDD
jgi:hypothetical protein